MLSAINADTQLSDTASVCGSDLFQVLWGNGEKI